MKITNHKRNLLISFASLVLLCCNVEDTKSGPSESIQPTSDNAEKVSQLPRDIGGSDIRLEISNKSDVAAAGGTQSLQSSSQNKLPNGAKIPPIPGTVLEAQVSRPAQDPTLRTNPREPANPKRNSPPGGGLYDPAGLSDVDLIKEHNFSGFTFLDAQEQYGPALSNLKDVKSGSDLSDILKISGPLELKEIRSTELPNGTVVTRYQQSFRGIPIQGADITLSNSASSAKLSGDSIFAFPSPLANYADVTDELYGRLEKLEPDLKKIALEAVNSEFDESVSNTDTRRDDFTHFLRRTDNGLELTTSMSFLFRGKSGFRNPVVTIDTESREIVKIEDKVKRLGSTSKGVGGNRNTGLYIHGENEPGKPDFPMLQITKTSTICSLDSQAISTIDAKNLGTLDDFSSATPYEFACDSENINMERSINNAHSPLNDAHAFSTLTIEMLKAWFPTFYNSQETYPELTIFVHEQDGDNASYFENALYLQDGNIGRTFPVVVPDIVAHEMGHWFSDLWKTSTSNSSGIPPLTSSDFKGIEESYSDMFGVLLESYLNSEYNYNSLNLQKIGEAAFPNGSNYVRDICNPRAVTHISHVTSSMDEHKRAGLFNKVFCELSKKGNWNFRKSFELFTHANLSYWNSDDSFLEAAIGVENAARDLQYETDDIFSVFETVGICLVDESICQAENSVKPPVLETYIFTERLMLSESSEKVCQPYDDTCYQESCEMTLPGSEYGNAAACFTNENSFLCIIECQNEVSF